MSMPDQTLNELPAWLREILDSEPDEDAFGKRQEPRYYAGGLAKVVRMLNDETFSVRLYNAGPSGIGFTSRTELGQSETIQLCPDGVACEESQKVKLRVAHCTQTVQGYKVGCEIV